jgi:hypothetical protein
MVTLRRSTATPRARAVIALLETYVKLHGQATLVFCLLCYDHSLPRIRFLSRAIASPIKVSLRSVSSTIFYLQLPVPLKSSYFSPFRHLLHLLCHLTVRASLLHPHPQSAFPQSFRLHSRVV